MADYCGNLPVVTSGNKLNLQPKQNLRSTWNKRVLAYFLWQIQSYLFNLQSNHTEQLFWWHTRVKWTSCLMCRLAVYCHRCLCHCSQTESSCCSRITLYLRRWWIRSRSNHFQATAPRFPAYLLVCVHGQFVPKRSDRTRSRRPHPKTSESRFNATGSVGDVSSYYISLFFFWRSLRVVSQ